MKPDPEPVMPPNNLMITGALAMAEHIPSTIPVAMDLGMVLKPPRAASTPAISAITAWVPTNQGITGLTNKPPTRNDSIPVVAPQRHPIKTVTRMVPTASRKMGNFRRWTIVPIPRLRRTPKGTSARAAVFEVRLGSDKLSMRQILPWPCPHQVLIMLFDGGKSARNLRNFSCKKLFSGYYQCVGSFQRKSSSVGVGFGRRMPRKPVFDCFAVANDLNLLIFSSIAQKLDEDPSLLDIPLQNIERWVARGHPDAQRLLAWQEKIKEARSSKKAHSRLLTLLRDSSPGALRWKGFSPFAGVLSQTELDTLSGLS